MTFQRNTYQNRINDTRSCATCKFAAAATLDRGPSDTRPSQVTRCHRHAPVLNDNNYWFFPQVDPVQRCSEWEAEGGAARDESGVPSGMRCDLCQHSSSGGAECRRHAPVAISHEGKAIFPKVGTMQWCGDHVREAGVENERFLGQVPEFLRAATGKG